MRIDPRKLVAQGHHESAPLRVDKHRGLHDRRSAEDAHRRGGRGLRPDLRRSAGAGVVPPPAAFGEVHAGPAERLRAREGGGDAVAQLEGRRQRGVGDLRLVHVDVDDAAVGEDARRGKQALAGVLHAGQRRIRGARGCRRLAAGRLAKALAACRAPAALRHVHVVEIEAVDAHVDQFQEPLPHQVAVGRVEAEVITTAALDGVALGVAAKPVGMLFAEGLLARLPVVADHPALHPVGVGDHLRREVAVHRQRVWLAHERGPHRALGPRLHMAGVHLRAHGGEGLAHAPFEILLRAEAEAGVEVAAAALEPLGQPVGGTASRTRIVFRGCRRRLEAAGPQAGRVGRDVGERGAVEGVAIARDAGIARGGEDVGQPLGHLRPHGGMGRVGGKVSHLIGVGAQVVEFLGGPLAEGVVVVPGPLLHAKLADQPGLGRAVIHVGEGHEGVALHVRGGGQIALPGEGGAAQRPAIGGEVADIEVVAGAERPMRIGQIALPRGVDMTLSAGDDPGARLVHQTRRARPQHAEQAAAGHDRRRRDAAGFEERGRQIHQVDEVIHHPPAGDAGAAGHKRHGHAVVVEVALAAGHAGHPVVAAGDDERVGKCAGRLQLLEDHAHGGVPGLDLAHVVGKVGADFGNIRHEAGQVALQRVGIDAPERLPRALLPGAVRDRRPTPVAEGLARLAGGQ